MFVSKMFRSLKKATTIIIYYIKKLFFFILPLLVHLHAKDTMYHINKAA